MRSRLVLIATTMLASASANAASFDCTRARALDERSICADRFLNDQDVRLSTWLTVLGHIQLMGGNGAMRDDQRVWLANRHFCGSNRICLARAYDRRITDLTRNYGSWAAKFR